MAIAGPYASFTSGYNFLSAFAKTTDLPDESDFGVLSVTGDNVVAASSTNGNVVLTTKLDNSGNVKFEKTTNGLKGTVNLTHDHDDQYKELQDAKNGTFTGAQVPSTWAQDAQGVVSITSRTLTPGDIGAQPVGNYKVWQELVKSELLFLL